MSIDIKDYKKVLYLDLNDQSHVFKVDGSLWNYIGGVGIAYKLLEANLDLNPVILATGPLSGYFPYASKSCVLYISNGKLVEKYGGGSISGLMNMLGIDAIVISGRSTANLAVSINEEDVSISQFTEEDSELSRFDFAVSSNKIVSEGYFSYGNIEDVPSPIDNLVGINIDFTKNVDFSSYYDYEKIYNTLLDDYRSLTVEPRNNPSCMGCPMGCDFSHEGEDHLNVAVLARTLIACGYAESLYKSIPMIYSCLNSLGYRYHHSDLEKFPGIFGELKVSLNMKLNS